MPDNHKNFSYSLVATAPVTATAGTSLTVTTGDGAKFPTPPFNATVWITGANPTTANAEIVRVTAISTDTLTIVRAQENSTARTIIVGDQIAATITAKTLTDAETSITGTANQVIASAATGAVTLSLPQSIATTSNPTFNSVTFKILYASDVVGTNRGTEYYTAGGATRWFSGVNSVAESGSNAGSNFSFFRYSDVGAYLGNALVISRATGAATFEASVTATSLVKSGGTAAQFLKADGSVDASTYLTSSSDARLITGVVTADVLSVLATPAKITTLDKTLAVGIYQFKYYIRYQSAATTTGIRLSVNFTGTTGFFTAFLRWVDVGSAAATTNVAPTQAGVLAAGHLHSGFSARAKSVAGWGVTLSVDTANADMMIIIEGTFEATASGNIELWHGSEIAAASTLKAGTNLTVIKVN